MKHSHLHLRHHAWWQERPHNTGRQGHCPGPHFAPKLHIWPCHSTDCLWGCIVREVGGGLVAAAHRLRFPFLHHRISKWHAAPPPTGAAASRSNLVGYQAEASFRLMCTIYYDTVTRCFAYRFPRWAHRPLAMCAQCVRNRPTT